MNGQSSTMIGSALAADYGLTLKTGVPFKRIVTTKAMTITAPITVKPFLFSLMNCLMSMV